MRIGARGWRCYRPGGGGSTRARAGRLDREAARGMVGPTVPCFREPLAFAEGEVVGQGFELGRHRACPAPVERPEQEWGPQEMHRLQHL